MALNLALRHVSVALFYQYLDSFFIFCIIVAIPIIYIISEATSGMLLLMLKHW